MRNKYTYTILIIVCVIGFWVFENFYTPAHYSNSSNNTIENGEGETKLLPKSSTGQIIYHDYFTLSYNEPYEQAEWVAYELKKSHLTYDDRKRPYFIEDPKVRTKSADWRNYKRSGYDRGHLCPAGDRRFSEMAYNQTFYTSNITPQRNDFNAGVWNRLEQKVRYWCKKYGDLYVITGGVLETGLDEIGDEDVDVPEYYYKIVYRNDESQKAVAFLIPHEESTRSLSSFLVSIDKIEEVTGIDFFEKLPESEQQQFEGKVNSSHWKF